MNQPKRQVSMNMGSSRNGPLVANGGESDETSRFEPKKRSKTQEDLKVNRNLKAAPSTPRKPVNTLNKAPIINSGGNRLNKTPQRYNPERYSPRLAGVASRYMPVSSSPSTNLSRNNSRKDSASTKDASSVPKPSLLSRLEQDESFMKNPLRRTTTISTTTSEDDEQSAKLKEKNTVLNKAPSFEKYVSKYSSGSDSSLKLKSNKPPTAREDNTEAGKKEAFADSGLIPPTEFQKLSMTEQLKQLKFHAKLKKQREEMMLTMQKKLEDFKNSKKAQQESKPVENRIATGASAAMRRTYDRDSNLTCDLDWEDQCATKIQAAWRGYTVRKNVKELFRKHKLVKCRVIQSQVQTLKESLHDMLEDHREFCKVNFDTTQKILNALRNFSVNNTLTSEAPVASNDFESFMRAKIQPLDQNGAIQSEPAKKEENSLLRENEELKSKLKALESRYHMLETKMETLSLMESVSKMSSSQTDQKLIKDSLDSSSQQPKLEIYPPLRVRLQKLNEKSVALKWDHNPLNILIDLEGYHVYINEELCGVMKAKDQIASINGIQEEGEYRIHLRAFYGEVESAKSNEVITRVKKKNSSNRSSAKSTSTSNNVSTFAHDTTNNLTTNESQMVNESSRKSTPRKRSSIAKSTDLIRREAEDDEKENNDKTLDSLTPSTTQGDLRSSTTTTSSSTTGSITGRPPKSQPIPSSSQEPAPSTSCANQSSNTKNSEGASSSPAPLIRKHKQNVLTVADNLIKNLGRVC